MLRRSIPRNFRREATPLSQLCRQRGQQRLYPGKSDLNSQQKTRSRVERVTSRLPKFLLRYTDPLVNAPLTHISAFLVLHEVTAVVPILGLATIFHYTNWLPPYISEGQWVNDGVQKFGDYFRKKGWLGHEKTRRFRWWGKGEGGLRVVVEYASSRASNDGRNFLSHAKAAQCHRIGIDASTNRTQTRNGVCDHQGFTSASPHSQCLGHPLVCPVYCYTSGQLVQAAAQGQI